MHSQALNIRHQWFLHSCLIVGGHDGQVGKVVDIAVRFAKFNAFLLTNYRNQGQANEYYPTTMVKQKTA